MQAPQDDLSRFKVIFDEKRKEWLTAGHLGKWALLGDDGLRGFYDSYEGAVNAAADAYGPKPCLLQQVLEEDKTDTIQHVFWAAG